MKIKIAKTALISAASAILAAAAQAQTSPAPAAQPAAATPAPAAAPAAADTKKDRSYIADFADEQASVSLFDEKSKKETPVTVKSISDTEVVFTGGGGELSVSKKNPSSLKVNFKPDSGMWLSARKAYGKGNWEEAILYMRKMVYPLIPLMSLPDETFKGHSVLEMYLNALVNADRLVEAESIIAALPLGECARDLVSSALSVAEVLANKGMTKQALAAVERVPFTGDNAANIPDLMNALGALRKQGMIKECAVIYTKIANVESPQKNEATLWMVYCDLSLGKKMSAEIYLNQIKLDQNSPEFSLLQMDRGMLASKAEKPNLNEVLDLYAEGIVFGSLSSSWMPELLYNAGMMYKKLGRQYAANEIFAQMAAFYPDDTLTKKGQKEIVKVERKKVKAKTDDDDDDDE